MQLVIRQRPDGQTEIVVGDQSFLIRRDLPEVEIPKGLLQDLLLSELPEQIGVKPLGMDLIGAAQSRVDCWLYGFRDGYASARVKIAERGGPSAWLLALRDATCKRQQENGDVEAEELYEVDGDAIFSFLVDLMEDVSVQQAFERMDHVLCEIGKSGEAFLPVRSWKI